jgi:uncharacterized protein involved in copper resistance
MSQGCHEGKVSVLRYEILRELAPLRGLRVGGRSTEPPISRRRGEDFDVPALVAGVRFWF